MHVQSVQNCCFFIVKYANLWRFCCRPRRGCSRAWGPFLESPETLRRNSGYIFLFVSSKRKASRGMKLCSSFTSYSLYNLWKGQLYRISGSQFYLWLFGLEKVFGTFEKRAPGFQNNRRYLSRNGAPYRRSRSLLNFVLLLWRAFGMGGESGCQV